MMLSSRVALSSANRIAIANEVVSGIGIESSNLPRGISAAETANEDGVAGMLNTKKRAASEILSIMIVVVVMPEDCLMRLKFFISREFVLLPWPITQS